MSTAGLSAATLSSLTRAGFRIASVVSLSLIGTSLACGASLDEIQKRGYMVVATEDDYPPFEAVVNGKPLGYDHALLALLKKEAGFEIRQEILPWQGILPGVASGKYDSAVTAAVITDERAKSLDFTMPIAEIDDGLCEAHRRRPHQEHQGPERHDDRRPAGWRLFPGDPGARG